ncbi:hypothetical protein K438DRAFT_2120420, partial [Mycena galopus ATCC 62051]
MARNQGKAQMLSRFREAQAAELRLGTRGDRQPCMASACKSLRECEQWRASCWGRFHGRWRRYRIVRALLIPYRAFALPILWPICPVPKNVAVLCHSPWWLCRATATVLLQPNVHGVSPVTTRVHWKRCSLISNKTRLRFAPV